MRRAGLLPAVAFAATVATGAAGAADPAGDALDAAAALREAVGALQSAEKAKDRVAALTGTIGAYEEGLAALRESLRRLTVRERELAGATEAEEERLGRILGAMAAAGRLPDAPLLLHPGGPAAAVRTGMLLSATAEALDAEADRLRVALAEIRTIRDARAEAAATVQAGLVAAQGARTALSQAVQEREGLPRRFLDDPEELQQLVADVTTLEDFARGISAMETDIGAPLADFAAAKGVLPLPVLGHVLRKAGEADAAGIARPGLVLATEPSALVTAPWPATIRYRGPLLDYRNVMILEPAEGYLLVLAGLGVVYGETGDVLDAGAPLGLMPDDADRISPNGTGQSDGAGAGSTGTLYMELRQGDDPVDPAPWFSETKEDD